MGDRFCFSWALLDICASLFPAPHLPHHPQLRVQREDLHSLWAVAQRKCFQRWLPGKCSLEQAHGETFGNRAHPHTVPFTRTKRDPPPGWRPQPTDRGQTDTAAPRGPWPVFCPPSSWCLWLSFTEGLSKQTVKLYNLAPHAITSLYL